MLVTLKLVVNRKAESDEKVKPFVGQFYLNRNHNKHDPLFYIQDESEGSMRTSMLR